MRAEPRQDSGSASTPEGSTPLAYQNTDRELWRDVEGNDAKDAGDYYADSIHVTEQGGIGINCGGTVYVKSLRKWHALAGGPNSLAETEPTDALITREHAIACARNVGRHQGYAIALHGSGVRDIDLIAVPWIEPCAITPLALAEMIAAALPGAIKGKAEKKSHGRMGFVILPRWRYGFDTWYIDLSVMPRRKTRSESPSGAVATPKDSGGGR